MKTNPKTTQHSNLKQTDWSSEDLNNDIEKPSIVISDKEAAKSQFGQVDSVFFDPSVVFEMKDEDWEFPNTLCLLGTFQANRHLMREIDDDAPRALNVSIKLVFTDPDNELASLSSEANTDPGQLTEGNMLIFASTFAGHTAEWLTEMVARDDVASLVGLWIHFS